MMAGPKYCVKGHKGPALPTFDRDKFYLSRTRTENTNKGGSMCDDNRPVDLEEPGDEQGGNPCRGEVEPEEPPKHKEE